MANIEHNTIVDPELHEPKGIAAASANTVYVADGAASGSFTQITPANLVMVHSASDLPAAVSDVRTLVANTIYQISGQVDIGNDEIVMAASSMVIGLDNSRDEIVSTTANTLITSTDKSCQLIDVKLTAASGTLFDFDGTGVEIVSLIRVVASGTNIGDFDNLSSTEINGCSLTGTTTGITFTGAHLNTEIINTTIDTSATAAATTLDLQTATFNHIHIENIKIKNGASGIGIDVAASGANINSGGSGYIFTCSFDTPAQASNYVAGADKWAVGFSNGVAPSTPAATGFVTGNATATTFSGTGSGNDVVVDFGTAFSAGSIQRRFTTANTGATTYDGADNILSRVNCNISASIAGGASRTYNFYIAKNGTLIADTIIQRTFDGTNKGALTCSALTELVNGDIITLRVRAETATTSITVDTMSLTISGLDQ